MIATQVASPFLAPFKLTLVVAVFVAMPFLLYQTWAFIAPGLYRHEKRLAVPLLASSVVLFYLGMLFAYVVVFPLVFGFFTSVTPDGVAQMPDISFYLEFVLKLFFAFGIAFEIPIATILIVAAGLTTPKSLARKRPYVIVGVFVAGMLLTPPDAISQTLLAIPMWLLFELGIFFSRFFQRQSQAGEEADDEAEDAPVEAGSAASYASKSTVHPFGAAANPVPGGTVGRDIDAADIDEPGRFRPMSDAEMDAELDAIEAEEAADAVDTSEPGPVQTLIELANKLRAAGSTGPARDLLYRVLEEGDSDQRRVARNILADLDSD
jgi:sec-independent protein translocase protein TatC